MKETAKIYNYELIILGYSMKWKGFGWRIKLILDFLRTLPKDEIIMVVDAYDVILLRESSELLEEFRQNNSKFLCGAFRKLDGILGRAQEFEFGKTKDDLHPPYNNLCAGTWITHVETALYLYSKYDIKDKDDDQILLNRMYEDYGRGVITPDTNFNIFCTIFPNIVTRRIKGIDNIIITDDKRIKCGITNTYPFVIHALCNTHLDDILIKLGYTNCKSNTTITYLFKKAVYHIKVIFRILFRFN